MGSITFCGLLSRYACALLLFVFAATAFAAQVKRQSLRTVTITSKPNAVVWINDVRFGKTDAGGKFAGKVLATGALSVRVRADGFKEVTTTVPGARAEVSVPLTKTSDEAELAYQEAERLAAQDRAKAADAYRKAIRLRPAYLEAHIGLARVHAEAGEFEKAEAAIRAARRIRPAIAEISAIEGRVLKDTGDEEKSVASFRRAIREGKGFQPEAYTGLGLLFKERAESAGNEADFARETANYGEATKYLSTAATQLAGAPDGMVVLQLLGLIYENQKKFDDAVRTYEQFLEIFPDSNEATAVRSFIEQIKKQAAASK